MSASLLFLGLLASSFLYLWQAYAAGATEVAAIRKAQGTGAFVIAWILLLGLSWQAYSDRRKAVGRSTLGDAVHEVASSEQTDH